MWSATKAAVPALLTAANMVSAVTVLSITGAAENFRRATSPKMRKKAETDPLPILFPLYSRREPLFLHDTHHRFGHKCPCNNIYTVV